MVFYASFSFGEASSDRRHRAHIALRALLSLVVSLAILASVILDGCEKTTPPCTACPTAAPTSPTPSWSELPFETIAQGDQSYYKRREPAMIVVASPEEIARGIDLFEPNPSGIRERLQALDYRTDVALVVFQGQKNTGGYRVRIERIARRGDEMVCYALSLFPRPDEVVTMEATSPFQLVHVRKPGDWREMRFTLSITATVSP